MSQEVEKPVQLMLNRWKLWDITNHATLHWSSQEYEDTLLFLVISSKRKEVAGCQSGPRDRSACGQIWGPEFNPGDSHNRRKEHSSQPLEVTCSPKAHMREHQVSIVGATWGSHETFWTQGLVGRLQSGSNIRKLEAGPLPPNLFVSRSVSEVSKLIPAPPAIKRGHAYHHEWPLSLPDTNSEQNKSPLPSGPLLGILHKTRN